MAASIEKYITFTLILLVSFVIISGCTGSSDTKDRGGDIDKNISVPMANVLNTGNFHDVVKNVFSLLNTEPMDSIVWLERQIIDDDERRIHSAQINRPDTPVYELIELPDSNLTGFASNLSEYECVGEGTYSVYLDAGSPNQGTRDQVYSDCQIGAYTFLGIAGSRGGPRGTISEYPFYEFTVSQINGESTTLTGLHYSGDTSFVSLQHRLGWKNTQLKQTLNEGLVRISDFNLEKRTFDSKNGSYHATLVADYRVYGSMSDDNELSVTASLSFSGVGNSPESDETPFEWQTGSIEIVADDGSKIEITPTDLMSNSWSIVLDQQAVDIIPATGDFQITCSVSEVCPSI